MLTEQLRRLHFRHRVLQNTNDLLFCVAALLHPALLISAVAGPNYRSTITWSARLEMYQWERETLEQ